MATALLVGTVFAAETKAQTTFHVDAATCPGPGTGTVADPFCKIQDAIVASANGDEIIVAPGTYNELITFIGKGVTLRSSGGRDVTIIDAGPVADPGTALADEYRIIKSDSFSNVDDGVPGAGFDAWLEPLSWTKHPENPVIPETPVGNWDHWKSDPFVLKEGDLYRMWYATNAEGSKTQIGYAESMDGIAWVHHPEPVLLLGIDGEWDDEDVETPTVVKHEDLYHLWYSGRGEPEGTNPIGRPDAAYRIGHAVSNDGINWNKDLENPVVDVGPPNIGWDWLAAAEPSVIVNDGLFEMWYTGATIKLRSGKFFLQIGRATSLDGTTWEKSDTNPVLRLSLKNGITTPSVLYNEPDYELWFTLYDEATGIPGGPIGYATSLDGISWRISPRIALSKGKFRAWDRRGIFGPTVLLDGDTYKMWYSGVRIDRRGIHLAIGYATGSAR